MTMNIWHTSSTIHSLPWTLTV